MWENKLCLTLEEWLARVFEKLRLIALYIWQNMISTSVIECSSRRPSRIHTLGLLWFVVLYPTSNDSIE